MSEIGGEHRRQPDAATTQNALNRCRAVLRHTIGDRPSQP
jgi:hypothetical protein